MSTEQGIKAVMEYYPDLDKTQAKMLWVDMVSYYKPKSKADFKRLMGLIQLGKSPLMEDE
jgi:hypothetical protein